MNLRWKEFERRVRQPLRARIAQSPADWREYRRYGLWQKLTQTVHLPGWTLRMVVVPLVAAALGSGLGGSRALLGAILVWVVLTALFRLGQLTVGLRTSSRLQVFGHLPMSDTEIFAQQWSAWLRATTIGSVLDFACLYCLLAVAAGCGWRSPWIGLVFAVAQWLVVLSAVVVFVTWCWNRRFMGPVLRVLSFRGVHTPLKGRLAGAGRLLLVVAVVCLLGYGRRSLAGWAVVVPPLGLAYEGLGLGRASSLLAQVWTAFSLGTILMLLPLTYRRLRATYRLPEGLVAGEQERGEVEAVRRGEMSDDLAEPCAQIKAAIRRREFLQEADWRRAGWLESFTARWFTPRERTAAEFLFAGTPGWTRVLKRVLVVGVLCALVGYFVPRVFQSAGFFVPLFAITFGARNADLAWPGARTRTVSGSSMAMHSLYPIGFWRLALINLKIRLGHLGLLLAALGVAGAALLFRHAPWLEAEVGYYAGLSLLLVLSLTPLGSVLQVSQGTNDTSTLRGLALALVAAPLFIALTVTMFLLGGGWGYLAGVGLLLTSYGVLVLYGHAYNHGWFDAQRKPQASTSFKLSRSQ